MNRSATSPSTVGAAEAVRGLFRRLVRIAVGYAGLTVVASSLLNTFGLDLTPNEIFASLSIAPPVLLITLVVDLLALNWYLRPLQAFLAEIGSDQTDHPGQLETGVAQRALVRLLNLPLLTVVRVLTFHALAGYGSSTAFTLYGNIVLDVGWPAWRVMVNLGSFFVVTFAHAILEYFAVVRAVRPLIPLIQTYAGELPPEQRRRIVPVGIRQRLLSLSIWIAFIPLVVLGFTVMVRVNNLLLDLGVGDVAGRLTPLIIWIVVLVALGTLVTVSIAIMMARDTAQLAGDMVQSMQRVEEGDLEARLEVVSSDEFATLYEGFNRMTRGLQERERLRDAFGRYVAPELAEEVMRRGVSLGGESLSASVLFADIRGFTALSERLTPPEVVGLLNRYFAAVGPAIAAEGGWIDKFGGDSLLAVFGAPLPQPDHAQRALRAALGMRVALADFNTRQQQIAEPALRIGIGIDCGEMVAGSVGSPERMEYTVIGDTVNVASRIQSLNKPWGTDILVSAGVYAAAGGDLPAREMPPAEVPGKSEPIQVYALE